MRLSEHLGSANYSLDAAKKISTIYNDGHNEGYAKGYRAGKVERDCRVLDVIALRQLLRDELDLPTSTQDRIISFVRGKNAHEFTMGLKAGFKRALRVFFTRAKNYEASNRRSLP